MTVQVVSPYRPFDPESPWHLALGPFDWIGALRMLAQSVDRSCGWPVYAITDVETTVPVPAWHFATTERRLMLWILEVSLRYIESPHFDRDTVMISPDTLVVGDLSGYFMADLGVIVRLDPKHAEQPVLNSVQFWRHGAKGRLIDLYRLALDLARSLPEDLLIWGADSEPLRQLVAPLAVGVRRRGRLKVAMLPSRWIIDSISAATMERLDQGEVPDPSPVPVVDFRGLRKRHMAAYFDAVLGQAVLA